MRQIFHTILLTTAVLFGCVAHEGKIAEIVRQPGLESIVLSYDISSAQRLWAKEVAAEYPNAVLVVAHGLTDPISGEWSAYPSHGPSLPVADLVARIRENHPRRHLVLLICNPDGQELEGVSNVSYAPESVWVMPDSRAGLAIRNLIHPEGVGSFEEFWHVE